MEGTRRSVHAAVFGAVMCALAVASAVPGKATSDATHTIPGRSFTFSGPDCLEATTVVPAPVSHLQHFVPAPFAVKQHAPGIGLLAVGIGRCDSMGVEGQLPATDVVFSDVGIAIDPPDESVDGGPIGSNFYQLWHASNADDIVASMSKIGMRTGLVEDASFGITADPLTAMPMGVKGVMPWSYSTYKLSNTGPVPGPGDIAGANTWWHEGDGFPSVIRIDRSATQVGSQPAASRLSMRPGSPLATVAGTTEFAGAGVTLYLGTESGRVQLVNLSTTAQGRRT